MLRESLEEWSLLMWRKVMVFIQIFPWVVKMAQRVKDLATKPEKLSSIPRTHMGKEKTDSYQLPLTFT